MVAFDNLVYMISDHGYDNRLLGLWSYVTITGKHNLKSTIITCYCPCKGFFPGSIYSQHLIYMSKNSIEIL